MRRWTASVDHSLKKVGWGQPEEHRALSRVENSLSVYFLKDEKDLTGKADKKSL